MKHDVQPTRDYGLWGEAHQSGSGAAVRHLPLVYCLWTTRVRVNRQQYTSLHSGARLPCHPLRKPDLLVQVRLQPSHTVGDSSQPICLHFIFRQRPVGLPGSSSLALLTSLIYAYVYNAFPAVVISTYNLPLSCPLCEVDLELACP